MKEIERILKEYEVTSGVEFFMQVPHIAKAIEQYYLGEFYKIAKNHKQYVIKARIEELEKFDVNYSIPTTWQDIAKERIAELKKGLN